MKKRKKKKDGLRERESEHTDRAGANDVYETREWNARARRKGKSLTD